MSEDTDKTLRILRKPDASQSNRNVWSGPIESGDFELVSTMMLQNILESDDGTIRQQIAEVAELDVEGQGILAHDAKNDSYEIVDGTGNEEFSLVSTQMLHRILKNGDANDASEEPLDIDTGFDPYNSD